MGNETQRPNKHVHAPEQVQKLMDKNPRTIYPDVDGLAKSLANPFKAV